MEYRIISSLVTFLLISNSVYEAESGNILFFHLGATASHRTSIWPLATKLADSGHNVTYMFPITKRPGSHPKIEELQPSLLLKAVDELVGDFDINFRLNNTVDQWLRDAFETVSGFCDLFFDSPEVHQWLAKPGLSYDLVMIDGGFGQCAYPLVYKFQAKLIIFNPVTMPVYWDTFGVVPETSSIPEMMFYQKPDHLQSSLISRTINTLSTAVWRYAFMDTVWKIEASIRNKLNLTDMPSFDEIEQETALVLHNTYFIEDYPMSLPPMFISYSGLLCTEKSVKERKPLAAKLESFISDKNSKGFVYVSFGSAVIASAMPKDLRNQFMTAFASFPELKFLWRWTGPIPENTPKNVLLQSWFPQLDILAHPKIKGFVMQGGRPSAQEAICYGVPMIILPIFGDQDFSAHRLESIGAAISLDITKLTSDNLIAALTEVIHGDKYSKRVQQLSSMFRDRPMDPVDNAIYWVEYVLRHDTSLMKPLGMKQTWYQRRFLDVYALLSLVALVAISLIGLLCYLATKLVFGIFSSLDAKIRKRKVD